MPALRAALCRCTPLVEAAAATNDDAPGQRDVKACGKKDIMTREAKGWCSSRGSSESMIRFEQDHRLIRG